MSKIVTLIHSVFPIPYKQTYHDFDFELLEARMKRGDEKIPILWPLGGSLKFSQRHYPNILC